MWDLFLQLCTQTPQINPSQKPTIDDHKPLSDCRLASWVQYWGLLSIQIRDQQIRLKISIKKYKQIPVYGHNLLDGGKIVRLSVFASLWCGKYFHIVVYATIDATSKNTTEIIATSTIVMFIQSVGRHTVSRHFLTNYFHVLIHNKFNGVNWYWNWYW